MGGCKGMGACLLGKGSSPSQAQAQSPEPRPPRERMRIIRMALSTPLEAQTAPGISVQSGTKYIKMAT